MFIDTETQKPDFINEAGVKWWLDKSTTSYAVSKGLKNVHVFLVEEVNKNKTRIILENNVPVYEHQQLEAIGVQLDVMAFIKDDVDE